jgi:hypothetical protein
MLLAQGQKKAEEIGIKLVHILSTAVTPEIVQSDIGNVSELSKPFMDIYTL